MHHPDCSTSGPCSAGLHAWGATPGYAGWWGWGDGGRRRRRKQRILRLLLALSSSGEVGVLEDVCRATSRADRSAFWSARGGTMLSRVPCLVRAVAWPSASCCIPTSNAATRAHKSGRGSSRVCVALCCSETRARPPPAWSSRNPMNECLFQGNMRICSFYTAIYSKIR